MNSPEPHTVVPVKPIHVYVMAETQAGREAWLRRLLKAGCNYFVSYHDTRSRFALMASSGCAWVRPGTYYHDA